jgi:hypothetical protein
VTGRIARFVLRLRFPKAVYQALNTDSATHELAKPIATLLGFATLMFLSTAFGIWHLNNMQQGVAKSCVAFEYQSWHKLSVPSLTAWTSHTIQDYVAQDPNTDDVRFTYVLVHIADANGVSYPVLTSPPYNVDVSHMQFPLTLSLWHENAVVIDHLISYNFLVQLSNLAWLVLSFMCLWGYFGLSVLAPAFHALQQGFAALIVYSAAAAMLNPPAVTPPLGKQEQLSYDVCKGNDHGVWTYSMLLIVQCIIAACMPGAAEVVRRPILPLIEFAKAFEGIKVLRKAKETGRVCPICLESLDAEVPGDADASTLWALPCSHTYHKDCVLPWLTKPGESLGTCPTCRGSNINLDPA